MSAALALPTDAANDPLLDAIRELHKAHDLYTALTADELRDFLAKVPTARGLWALKGRKSQLPPLDLEDGWLHLGGRSAGKTESMSQLAHLAARAGIMRMMIVCPVAADSRDVMVDGPAGLRQTAPLDFMPTYTESKTRMTWPNGATAKLFSADNPDSLRGYEAEICIIDELARMDRQLEVFQNAMLCLRGGTRPRWFASTTPRPTRLLKDLTTRPRVHVTISAMHENAANLPESFVRQANEQFAGTWRGKQELFGILLTEPEDAVFKEAWLHVGVVDEALFDMVVIGVDPSGGADETGIVAAAKLEDGRYAVLADRSCRGSPAHWGAEVVRLHDELGAVRVVCEMNYGRDMAVAVVKDAAARMAAEGKRGEGFISVKELTVGAGKAARAAPCALLYEQGQVLHRPGLDLLEAEMLQFSWLWDRKKDASPNRMDAAVHALTALRSIRTDIPMA